MKLSRHTGAMECLQKRYMATHSYTAVSVVARKDAITLKRPRVQSSAYSTKRSLPKSSPMWQSTTASEDSFTSLTNIWEYCANLHGDKVAIHDPQRTLNGRFTYKELKEEIENFAYGLKSLGLEPGNAVSLFSDSSCRWIVADQAIMMNTALDAVRGASTPLAEMQYIVQNSDSVGIISQDMNVFRSLFPKVSFLNTSLQQNFQNKKSNHQESFSSQLKFVVILWGEPSIADIRSNDFPIFSYEQLIDKGRDFHQKNPNVTFPEPSEDQIATIVYTSGTSGAPKGVPLTHKNILYQLKSFQDIIGLTPGSQILSLLPPWHIYERAVSYYFFSQGVQVIYSSIKTFQNDLLKYPPEAFTTVPLILDVLYKKIMNRLQRTSIMAKMIALTLMRASIAFIEFRRILNGVDLRFSKKPCSVFHFLKALILSWILLPFHLLARKLVHSKIREGLGIKRVIVSGGSSLGSHLDAFFESIGLPLINGWGLTETSPVLCCRHPDESRNIRGTVGVPLKGTEVKIVDPDTYQEVQDGSVGVILARGPGVMNGYQKNPEETAKVLTSDQWFNTGDRGWRCPSGVKGSRMAGQIVLTGRMKDTIVLSGGENVEPQPIEDLLCTSPLISHIMVIGQDHRNLGALVVPDQDVIDKERQTLTKEQLETKILHEIWKLEISLPDYRPHMHILAICLLDHPFSMDNGTLTKTMKIRREAIIQMYSKQVNVVLKQLR